MRLFSRKPQTPPAPATVAYDDANAYQVAWVTYYQEHIERIAEAVGWPESEQPGPPIAATLHAEADPKGRATYAVRINGGTIGYMPTSSLYYIKPKLQHPATPAAVALHKGLGGKGIAARVCV